MGVGVFTSLILFSCKLYYTLENPLCFVIQYSINFRGGEWKLNLLSRDASSAKFEKDCFRYCANFHDVWTYIYIYITVTQHKWSSTVRLLFGQSTSITQTKRIKQGTINFTPKRQFGGFPLHLTLFYPLKLTEGIGKYWLQSSSLFMK